MFLALGDIVAQVKYRNGFIEAIDWVWMHVECRFCKRARLMLIEKNGDQNYTCKREHYHSSHP